MDWVENSPVETVGKLFLMVGAILLILGFLLTLLGRAPFIGELPGDISVKWRNVTCYFPVVTSIVLSIVVTAVLNLIIWLLRK
ncbi:MAG: hypothetical protein CEE40_04040 [Chloroflexi bacterium B3_Chlor]|nr:MAG: hypothetical protein CEE40_04040 [Chloroflexi bacterium B3_Chlor]